MKQHYYSLVLLGATIYYSTLFAQSPAPAPVWTYNAAGQYDAIRSMTRDNYGNIYVCGPSELKKNNPDYVVIKYSTSGQELKVYRYNGAANGEDWPFAFTVDHEGYVYVTGRSLGKNSGYDIATVKFSPDGNIEWSKSYNGASNQNDFGKGMYVDLAGNVYVTGSADGPGTVSGNNLITIKYSSSGHQEWASLYNSLPDATDGSGAAREEGNAVVVDQSGSVYVTGATNLAVTIKYSASGVMENVAQINGSGRKLQFDPFGKLIMVSWGGVLVKFDPADLQVIYERTDPHATAYQDLAIDPDGNIYVTGWGRPSTTKDDYVTLKYNNEGEQQWIRYHNGDANDIDLVRGIAIDVNRNVYVTGYTRTRSGRSSISQFGTVKYDNNGNQLWVAYYIGTEKQGAEAFDIVTDAMGNVYVGGQNAAKPSDLNFATVKYTQAQSTSKLVKPTPSYHIKTYPNPFYQSCTIEFSLLQETNVQLDLFDMSGKQINSLLHKVLPAGIHKVQLNGSHLPAGTYLYKFQAGDVRETRRIVLLK